ncbi:hypothetical protein [Dyadobacter sp. MSC1_007]|jgi:polyhydroxyalkanoate synthesis regulator phasin|uniref:hypothetical protein n=1 Tax=Dyadobacter sp. MSC1_007 TaxID=2909264 RepID=UPI00202F3B52|nr:hypothetical protein [Dyadobacter sp. MSC1_007]
MELTIEINNPKARRLIDDLVDLGLITVKEMRPTWKERWQELSDNLPKSVDISEQEILEAIATTRTNPGKL